MLDKVQGRREQREASTVRALKERGGAGAAMGCKGTDREATPTPSRPPEGEFIGDERDAATAKKSKGRIRAAMGQMEQNRKNDPLLHSPAGTV